LIEATHAVVVGAGLGGIASALRLRARGYQVTLVDKCDSVGGRGRSFEIDGYKFDCGPTIITAPFLLDQLFELYGKKASDYYKLVPMMPWYRIMFADNSNFDYGGTTEATIAQINKFCPADAPGYIKLIEHCKKIFEVGFVQLGDQPFCSLKDMLQAMPDMVRLQSFKTVYELVSNYISDEHLRRALSFHPLLVGGNPYHTTSIYLLIQYLEREYGVYSAMGGTKSIIDALTVLMEEAGIKILLNSEVKQITTLDGKVTGIALASGTKIKSDMVIWNGCATYLYKNMLPDISRRKWTNKKVDNLKHSMGLFVLYFGTDKRYEHTAHHTIMLGETYKELLTELFDTKVLNQEPSVYLHAPTRTDSSLAPPGCDSFYVLCPVPNLQGDIDWSKQGPLLRDKIVALLQKRLLPDLQDHIVVERYITPQDFKVDLLSEFGAGFSIQPTLTQSAYFRYHNRSEEVAGLYLVGAGVHPGAGIPGVLCTAKTTQKLIDQDFTPAPVREMALGTSRT